MRNTHWDPGPKGYPVAQLASEKVLHCTRECYSDQKCSLISFKFISLFAWIMRWWSRLQQTRKLTRCNFWQTYLKLHRPSHANTDSLPLLCTWKAGKKEQQNNKKADSRINLFYVGFVSHQQQGAFLKRWSLPLGTGCAWPGSPGNALYWHLHFQAISSTVKTVI